MDQPNIVFILIDDMGWRDIECYGSSFYETPHIDRLANEGMMFTDGYAACPVCSPTRASVMSGKYPARVGVTQWIGGACTGKLRDVPYFHSLPASEISVAQALRDGGYQTWHVGKWHLGNRMFWPEAHGFDVNKGGCDMGAPWKGYFSPYSIPSLPDGPEGEYLTDRLTDEALTLIAERDTTRPYFLNFWHYAVHTPIQAPAELVEKYKQKAIDLGIDESQAIEVGEHFPVYHKRHQRVERRKFQSHATYAAMIENLDTNIGRLLDAIDASGQADNTMVIFTSDNGGLSTAEGSPTCNAPLAEGKGWMYEGGTREPMLIRWPAKVTAGSTCGVPITSPDFYPTFLAAAGLPARPEQHVDGESILPLLEGGQALERDAIYWHYPHYSNQGGSPGCSIRVGDYKLIEFFEDGKLELYNLREDLGETTDLAASETAKVAELHARLVAWRTEIEALIPQPNVNHARLFADVKAEG